MTSEPTLPAESVAVVVVPVEMLRLAVAAMNRCSCADSVRDASESVDAALEHFEQLLGLPFGWTPALIDGPACRVCEQDGREFCTLHNDGRGCPKCGIADVMTQAHQAWCDGGLGDLNDGTQP